jgi:GNAT superfamily N-acetyltransferase
MFTFYKRVHRAPLKSNGRLREVGMNDSVEVRPVRRDDFSAWKELWDGYNAFYGRSGDTALSSEVTRMTWSRFFDSYEPMHALVAEGAGKALIQAVYEHAQNAGSPRVYWQTHESNKVAMRLYDQLAERSGFLVYRHSLQTP